MTPQEAAAILVPQFETLVETEAAALIQKDVPTVITYLTNAEKTRPGFLGILKDLDGTIIDLCNLAISWANTITPPAAAEPAPAATA